MDVRADFRAPSGTFAIVGDSRPRDYLEFFLEDSAHVPRLVFDAIASESPAFVIHAGDLAVFGSRKSFWQGWQPFDRDAATLLEQRVPIYPVIGNHEYRGFTRVPLTHYFSRFQNLDKRTYYSLIAAGTLFLCLDSNFARMPDATEREQDAWLGHNLEWAASESEISLVVPVVHHPPFTNVSRRYLVLESRAVQRRWVPAFLQHPKIQLVVSGHVHAYEHILEGGKHFLVTGGGGSPRFVLRSKPHQRRVDLWPGAERIRPFHYLRCRSVQDEGSLEVEVVCLEPGPNWVVRERFSVSARPR
jgi:hypothetical protein